MTQQEQSQNSNDESTSREPLILPEVKALAGDAKTGHAEQLASLVDLLDTLAVQLSVRVSEQGKIEADEYAIKKRQIKLWEEAKADEGLFNELAQKVSALRHDLEQRFRQINGMKGHNNGA